MDMNNTVKSFLGNSAITGNSFIDSIFFIHLIPIILAYFNSIATIIKDVLVKIFKIFIHFFSNLMNRKVNGYVIGEITVSDYYIDIYNILDEAIFDPKVKSEINTMQILETMKKINQENSENIASFYDSYAYYRVHNIYHMEINYSDGNSFKVSKGYITSSDNKITKLFRFRDFVIKVTKEEPSEKYRHIDIEVITYNYNINISIGDLVNDFLKEKFNVYEEIPYNYHLILPEQFDKEIEYFITKGYKDVDNATLNYGDSEENLNMFGKDGNKDKKSFNNAKIIFNVTNITDEKRSYHEDMELVPLSKRDERNIKTGTFIKLYRKYIENKCIDFAFYGYYIKNNKYILIYRYCGTRHYELNIISKGKILGEKEIKDEVDFIIRKGIQKTKERRTSKEKSEVYISQRVERNWKTSRLAIRSLDTIYLPLSLTDEILREFNSFIEMEKLYKKFQIPYRKGILLYGPPGTGKTSLVRALAYEYQMDVYMINVNDQEINDETIPSIINSIGNKGNKILLFEDIDAAFAEKEKIKDEERIGKNKENTITEILNNTNIDNSTEVNNKDTNKKMELLINSIGGKSKHLTFAGLLNALDGMLSDHHGVVTIMTTNHIEKLGDALIRPGRIDRKFYLGECNDEQISAMLKKIIKIRLEFGTDSNTRNLKYHDEKYTEKEIEKFACQTIDKETKLSKYKPCELQQYLMRNIENIDDIFKNVNDISTYL